MKEKGFTLIELLAVIVILAIIALIATPIVLDIIDDTKESAQLRSAENYIKAAEMAVAKKMMDDSTFKPTECSVEEGNLKCDGKNVEVASSGEKPSSGTLTFKEGSITGVELELNGKTITKNTEGKLVYGDGSSDIVFDGNITFTYSDEFYVSNTYIDLTKFKNYANYKITIDNSNVYEVVSSKEKIEIAENQYVDSIILGNKSKIAYQLIDYENFGLLLFQGQSLNLEGEHHVKIEYVDDDAYPHVLRVFDVYIQIFSMELSEGAATVEIKDSDGNITNLDVIVTNDSGYGFIDTYDYNITIDNYYQSLQEGKIITVTVKQGDKSYEIGGTPFSERGENEYDCWSKNKYYYWGNNKLGSLMGC